MGGFFGAVSDRDVALDVFFGTDYHSHLGTRRGGMVLFDKKEGFQRQIHNIENTPFRTKFERDLADFRGHAGLGCISDSDPQPLLERFGNRPSPRNRLRFSAKFCASVFCSVVR